MGDIVKLSLDVDGELAKVGRDLEVQDEFSIVLEFDVLEGLCHWNVVYVVVGCQGDLGVLKDFKGSLSSVDQKRRLDDN